MKETSSKLTNNDNKLAYLDQSWGQSIDGTFIDCILSNLKFAAKN